MGTAGRRRLVGKASFWPLLLAVAAPLLGVPSYLAVQRWLGSPAFLVRPWPLWLSEAVLALLAARLALRTSRGLRRHLALGALGMALASGVGVAAFAKSGLPASSPEIAVGKPLPEVALPNELGHSISAGSLRGQPTVFVFYRGALCVACRAQLSAMAKIAQPYLAAGVRIFGVSADPPAVSAEWKDTLGLPFSLLSDPDQRLAQSLCSARAHCLVLVDPRGNVHWGALNDYWRGSQSAEGVLLAAYRLREQ
jgi:peroxiredoxin